MKILIADTFQDWGVERLKSRGMEVFHLPDLKDAALTEAVARIDCDVLIVRGSKVGAETLRASPRLALVIRAGAGYNTIDVATASKLSVFVTNCPGKNATAVAELTMGLILALDRRIVEATRDLKNGVWNKKLYSQARGVKGRTLGVVGQGQIGQLVTQRALAMEMEVVAWSRSLTFEKAEELGVRRMASIAEVAGHCDVLSVHLAATPETRKCLDADVFNGMRPGAYFINTSRGDIVDYDALIHAVETKHLRVGLDVFESEPSEGKADFKDRLMTLPGAIVYGTPHVGASTDQAQDAIAQETLRIVEHYHQTGQALNCVNLQRKSIARSVLLVRHLNRPGVLAHVLNGIREADLNVEEMQNVICEGAESACAQIYIDGALDDATLTRIQQGNAHILGVALKPLSV